MKDVIKLAAIQLRVSGDWKKDAGRAEERIAICVDKGASMAFFPELFGWTWFYGERDEQAFLPAETLEGPRVALWRRMANKRKIALGIPLFLREAERHYNAVALIGADGEIAGVYRAAHLPQVPGWEGKFYFTPGEDYPVLQLPEMPMGFLICWDAFFPEAFRLLALRGAKVVVVLTSATGANEDLWLRALSAQALFNGIYVIRVNRVGEKGSSGFCGGTFGLSPSGDLMGEPMGNVEGVAIYEIHRKVLEMTRREFPFLKDRHPESYQDLIEKP